MRVRNSDWVMPSHSLFLLRFSHEWRGGSRCFLDVIRLLFSNSSALKNWRITCTWHVQLRACKRPSPECQPRDTRGYGTEAKILRFEYRISIVDIITSSRAAPFSELVLLVGAQSHVNPTVFECSIRPTFDHLLILILFYLISPHYVPRPCQLLRHIWTQLSTKWRSFYHRTILGGRLSSSMWIGVAQTDSPVVNRLRLDT